MVAQVEFAVSDFAADQTSEERKEQKASQGRLRVDCVPTLTTLRTLAKQLLSPLRTQEVKGQKIWLSGTGRGRMTKWGRFYC